MGCDNNISNKLQIFIAKCPVELKVSGGWNTLLVLHGSCDQISVSQSTGKFILTWTCYKNTDVFLKPLYHKCKTWTLRAHLQSWGSVNMTKALVCVFPNVDLLDISVIYVSTFNKRFKKFSVVIKRYTCLERYKDKGMMTLLSFLERMIRSDVLWCSISHHLVTL